MGKGRKLSVPAPAEDDDALLDAAIAENKANVDREAESAANQLQLRDEAEAAQEAANKQLTDDVVAHALGRDPLTHQSVVDKLDALPVFHIKAANGNMVPTDDAGTPCGCFYLDADDAKRQMARLEETNAVLGLELEVTPLGTAFALSEGWSQVPEGTQLRLQGSLALLASLPEPPEPLPQVLQQRFNQLTSALPLIWIEGHRTWKGETPFYSDVLTLLSEWTRGTGKSKEQMPAVTVIDLRLVVARMLSQADDWRRVCFVPARKAMDHVRQLAVNNGDEPPPLLE